MNKPRSARPLSDLVRPALADAFKAQGFAAADILRCWPEIAGERLASHSLPLRIVWPPRRKDGARDAPQEPATLILKVESAFALDVEMAGAQIIERINAVFGWRCVGRLRLRQGPVTGPPAEKAAPARQLDGDAAARLERRRRPRRAAGPGPPSPPAGR